MFISFFCGIKPHLEAKNRDMIMKLLQREHEKSRGIILITHDMEIAKESDETFLLENGVLRAAFAEK